MCPASPVRPTRPPFRRRKSPTIDDTLHPTLTKGRPLDQLRIDALDAGPGRPEYGVTKVQEMEARTALNDFTMNGRRFYDRPAYAVNPYVGCQHQCAYCYVPDTIRAQRERWGAYAIVKRNLPTLLSHELRKKPKGTTYLCTGTDPYQPLEREHRITRACLEQLARVDWPVDVLTRGPLITRDIDVFQDFSHIRVGMSVPTLDDRMRQVIEPAAPPIEARLKALRRLADAGLRVYANYSPAYPFTGDVTPQSLVEAFQDAGVQWVNTSPFRRRRTILPVIQNRLRGTEHEDLLPMIRDDERQYRMFKTLGVAFERAKLPLGTGFFNPPFEAGPGSRPDVPPEVEHGGGKFRRLAARFDGEAEGPGA